MPMDETDKKLVNSLIWIAVIALLAYFIPGYGYGTKSEEARVAYEQLDQSSKKYMRYFTPMQPVHFGDYDSAPNLEAPPGYYLAELKKAYADSNAASIKELEVKQAVARFAFPEWTLVPEADRLNPGVYFHQMWQRKRNQVSTRLIEARVSSDDPNVGFAKWNDRADITINKAEELLRELAIAEKILELCMDAKIRQERDERAANLQPEAFMRIIKVDPLESRPTGPTKLSANPAYNEAEKNPNSPRFNKFLIKSYKPFIQEYPVDFVLHCDINTFMRFLHSVRRQGQFLVIRNLQIVSPAMAESQADKTELGKVMGDSAGDEAKRAMVRDEHVFVTMSAAGMDFFDPAVNPRGLYETKPSGPVKGPSSRRRSMSGATQTGQNNTPP
jgi:hypothetical protein